MDLSHLLPLLISNILLFQILKLLVATTVIQSLTEILLILTPKKLEILDVGTYKAITSERTTRRSTNIFFPH